MAVYQYRCGKHGIVEATFPMGTAPGRLRCSSCDGDADRVFSPPLLSRTPKAVTAAIDHAEKSRVEPDVVSAPIGPARRRRPIAPANPALRQLPRL
jgi:hypothetical protein